MPKQFINTNTQVSTIRSQFDSRSGEELERRVTLWIERSSEAPPEAPFVSSVETDCESDLNKAHYLPRYRRTSKNSEQQVLACGSIIARGWHAEIPRGSTMFRQQRSPCGLEKLRVAYVSAFRPQVLGTGSSEDEKLGTKRGYPSRIAAEIATIFTATRR